MAASILADGNLQPTNMFYGEVFWNGIYRPINVVCISEESLIGMGLLNGNELRIEVTPGGMVEINELP